MHDCHLSFIFAEIPYITHSQRYLCSLKNGFGVLILDCFILVPMNDHNCSGVNQNSIHYLFYLTPKK